MKPTLLILLACGFGLNASAAAAAKFEKPYRLSAGDEFVRVEKPGFAAPCLADLDGDGTKDLLVGQFRDGRIRVYRGLGAGKLAHGEWFKAGGKVAPVPGVW